MTTPPGDLDDPEAIDTGDLEPVDPPLDQDPAYHPAEDADDPLDDVDDGDVVPLADLIDDDEPGGP